MWRLSQLSLCFFCWHLPMTLIFSMMRVTLLHPSSCSLSPAEPGQVTVLQIWLLLTELREPGRLHQWLEGQEKIVRGQRPTLFRCGLHCGLQRGLHLRHQKSLFDRQWRVLVSVCRWPKQQWRQHHSHWYVPGNWARAGLVLLMELIWWAELIQCWWSCCRSDRAPGESCPAGPWRGCCDPAMQGQV